LKLRSGNFFSRINQKTLWLIAVLVILATAGWYYYSKLATPIQGGSESDGQTALTQRGNLILSASGSATLIAQTDATFGFDTSGQVTQVYVKVGDQVEAGQVLAQLDDTLAQMDYAEAQQTLTELYSAREIATVQQEIATAQDTESYAHAWLEYLLSPEVVEAEENLAIAEQKLTEAQAEAKSNPSDEANQKVKEGESAVKFLKDKLTQAQTYYEDIYLLENFANYERQGRRQVLVTYTDPYTGEELPEIDRPSEADIATARNNYIQSQETVKEGETYLEVLNTGIIPEDATGERLSELYNAQLALKNAQSALDETKLIAPISGTITALDLNVGEQAGDSSVITISQLGQPYTLDAYLDESDWEVAQAGNKVNVTFDLLPEQSFPGTVTSVYPELVASNNSSLIHILVQLDQSISQDLPVGTGANVDVVGGEARGAILVPVGAVHKEGDAYFVYIIQNGEQAKRDIEIGLQNESYAEIKSGLEAGETVVTE
jgi:HlyD family secretion protein